MVMYRAPDVSLLLPDVMSWKAAEDWEDPPVDWESADEMGPREPDCCDWDPARFSPSL